jgi:hypothetical protein
MMNSLARSQQEVERLRSAATGETTVEAALAELRELFPSGPSEIQIRTDNVYTIWFWPSERAAIRLYKVGETLADCMAQVRAATHTEGSEKSLDE